MRETATIYKDKNGNIIKAGMRLKHNDGTIERVYACEGENGTDLGFNASNEAWLERYPDRNREIYPLYQFNLREYEIIAE
jgi:hypothetical protein